MCCHSAEGYVSGLAHVQVGDFTLTQRASNVLLRAAQFMAVGFGSSVVGHTLTSRMVSQYYVYSRLTCLWRSQSHRSFAACHWLVPLTLGARPMSGP